ncbi:MAG TPA: metallophosphoesterase family protein [Thermoleophilaceae bacterium]|nr:metallophosphoesterase family protein [Thermoleophilaceae bacterium]
MSTHSDDTVERDRSTPARVAVVSDVHGNLPALEAVIADIDASGADATWCLGDLVGYGAQPDECVARAREACRLCLVGNHDLVVLGRLDVSTFSAHAAEAALWTRERIGTEAADFLGGLEPADASGPVGLYHGSPRDPVWEYLLSNDAAEASMELMDSRVGAIGHSHVALAFRRGQNGRAAGEVAPGGTTADLSEGDWILNPGAVGQPRDGDPRAAWLMLDLERWTATWHRVDYPIDDAADAIRRAGLPDMLADRLYVGQ